MLFPLHFSDRTVPFSLAGPAHRIVLQSLLLHHLDTERCGMGILNKFMKVWCRGEEGSHHWAVSKHICCQGYNNHPHDSALGTYLKVCVSSSQGLTDSIRLILIANQPKRLVQTIEVGANGFSCHLRCPLHAQHTHTECFPLISLPSHSKSQGLTTCFPVEREISDSEEVVFNLFNYIVYTSRVKKSSKDTKADLSLGSLIIHINMQFLVTLLQELNSVGSVQTLLLF